MGRSGARLGIGLVGAAVGAFFGNPALGFALGSIAAAVAIPPRGLGDSTIIGPKLQDSTVTSAAEGSPIDIGFGQVRKAGQLIWAAPREEREVTETTSTPGGKGGGGGGTQTQVSFQYFQSFAIDFGEGVAQDITKMWFDGNIVLDKSGTEETVIEPGISLTFYPGDEDQLPDPTIAEDRGDLTSANRGNCYIVFKDLPLRNFGNRLPNVTAEISYVANPINIVRGQVSIIPSIFTDIQTDSLAVDFNRNRAYAARSNIGIIEGISRFDLTTLQENYQITTEDAVVGPLRVRGDRMSVAPDGSLITNIGLAFTNLPIVRLDPETLIETARFGVNDQSNTHGPGGFLDAIQFFNVSLFGLLSRLDFVVVGCFTNELGIVSIPDLSWVWDSRTFFSDITTYPRFIGGVQGAVRNGEGTAYFTMAQNITGFPTSGDCALYKVTIVPIIDFFGNEVGSVDVRRIAVFTPSDLIPGASQYTSALYWLNYDAVDDTVIFGVSDETASQSYVIKYDPNAGQIVWRTPVNTLIGALNRLGTPSRLLSSTVGYISSLTGTLLNTATGEIIVDNEVWPGIAGSGSVGVYDSLNESSIHISSSPFGFSKFYFNRVGGQDVSLAEIVARFLDKAGVPSERYDVTDIADISIPGYLIARQTTARNAFQDMLRVYQVDVLESDFKIKFLKRGQASIKTFDDSDYIFIGDTGEKVSSSRIFDSDLPEAFTIGFFDRNLDYSTGSQRAKRIFNPTPAMFSRNQVGIDVPAVIDAQVAKQQAEINLFSAWNERQAFQLRTHLGNILLDPTDVVTLTLPSGRLQQARITESNIGADLTVELNLLGQETDQHLSTIEGSSGSGLLPRTVATSEFIRLFLLDIPILIDTQEVPNRAHSVLHYAMSGFQDGAFRRGTLYQSANGMDYTEVGASISAASWGTALTALPDIQDFRGTDETSTLRVLMTYGGDNLESVSQSVLLNGANVAALQKSDGSVEVFQYRDVVQESVNTYLLSGLIRGIRGTDTMAYNHTAGEIFLLLTSGTIQTATVNLDQIGVPQYFRSVGPNQAFETAEVTIITPVGNSLKPYKPVHETAQASGNDIILTWVRRTRVGGSFRDSVDIAPLSEDSELYEIDILDAPAGNIVRTITGLTSSTTTYTSSQQITDGFTPPLSSISIVVYQISGQVGRGFAREVTLNVE